jgi:NAD(P)-dependent dehydrogenase (short-subunit alcohol dehydrogenase family)
MSKAFAGQIALVTGASSGIGRAIAEDLASRGACVHLTGRDADRLAEVRAAIVTAGGEAFDHPADLTDDDQLSALVSKILAQSSGLNLLVHSAGTCTLDAVVATKTEDLDRNWAVNFRAPFLLTRDLMPFVMAAGGQVVFINSGAGLNAGGMWGAYAASKHALKALADSLRSEVAGQNVRVLSVYPGRTASPMQAAVKAREGQPYEPEKLIQPTDVSRMVAEALALPRTAQVIDINVRGA